MFLDESRIFVRCTLMYNILLVTNMSLNDYLNISIKQLSAQAASRCRYPNGHEAINMANADYLSFFLLNELEPRYQQRAAGSLELAAVVMFIALTLGQSSLV